MEERKGLVLRAARCVLLPAWLGVLVYHSPRFPGRGLGAVFGIARAGLMLISLAYPLVKRIPYLHDQITPHVSLQTILTVHICLLGVSGPLLAIIHPDHKFDSGLGILLKTFMLLVVVTGYAKQYLKTFVAHETTDKLLLLETARGHLDSAWSVLENS